MQMHFKYCAQCNKINQDLAVYDAPNMPSKPQVLFIAGLDESIPEFEAFQHEFEVVHYDLTSKDELLSRLETEFAQISGIYAGWSGFMPIGGLTADIIDKLPSSLKVIAITSVGYDSYNTEALKKRDIQLHNVPSLGAQDVADTVLYHTLDLFRHYRIFEEKGRLYKDTVKSRDILQTDGFDLKTGQLGVTKDTPFLKKSYPFGHIAGGKLVESPYGKRAGIVGFGNIGQAVGLRLSALGMQISYHKRTELAPEQIEKLRYSAQYEGSLEKLVGKVELLVLCLPGNASTEKLISRELITNHMKKGIRLINVGRGSIVDENAVIDALKDGVIAGFGADVYPLEPVMSSELTQRNDTSLTPHIGSSTQRVFDGTAAYALSNISTVLLQETTRKENSNSSSRVV